MPWLGLVFGDAYLEDHCVIQGNINVNSPLVYDEVMSGALKAYARANQSVVVSPFILGGAMGPVTQPALLAQSHAEAMAGIALFAACAQGGTGGLWQLSHDDGSQVRGADIRHARSETYRHSPLHNCAAGWGCRSDVAAN